MHDESGTVGHSKQRIKIIRLHPVAFTVVQTHELPTAPDLPFAHSSHTSKSKSGETSLPTIPATMNAIVEGAVKETAVEVAQSTDANTATEKNTSETVIYDLRPSDVLLGRGSRIDQYPGNLAFRELVNSCKHTYRTTTNHEIKREIAEYIIAQVEQRHNGRFLRRIEPDSNEAVSLGIVTINGNDNGVVGSSGKPKPAWIQIDSNASIEKTKQALREKGNSGKRNLAETTPLTAQQQQRQMGSSSSCTTRMASMSSGTSSGGILGHNTLPFSSASATAAAAWNQSVSATSLHLQQQCQQLLLSSLWPRTANQDSLHSTQPTTTAIAASLLPMALMPQNTESSQLLQAMLAAQSRSNMGGMAMANPLLSSLASADSAPRPLIRQLLLLQQQQFERDTLQQQLQQEQMHLELQRQQQILLLQQHNLSHLLQGTASSFAPTTVPSLGDAPITAPSLGDVWTGHASASTAATNTTRSPRHQLLVDSLITNGMMSSLSSLSSALTPTEAALLQLLQQQHQQPARSVAPEFSDTLCTRSIPNARESLLSPFRTNTDSSTAAAAQQPAANADHAALDHTLQRQDCGQGKG
jgi:hypothetical protein